MDLCTALFCWRDCEWHITVAKIECVRCSRARRNDVLVARSVWARIKCDVAHVATHTASLTCRSRRTPFASSHSRQVSSSALTPFSHSHSHLPLDMDAFKVPESFTEDDDQRFLNDTDLQPALDFVFYTSKILKENEGFLVGYSDVSLS